MMEHTEDFEKLIEEYTKPRKFTAGEIISAKIVSIDPENRQVIFDYQGKGEKWIPVEEFEDENGNINVKTGDIVELLVVSTNPLRFSYKGAVEKKAKDKIKKAFKNKLPVEGIISKKIKGGFIVLIDSIETFMPFSLSSTRNLQNYDNLIGKKIKGFIIEFDNNKIIFSRKDYLIKEKELKKRNFLKEMKIGSIYEGEIVNITDFGIFIEVSGIDGLVPIREITYKRKFNYKKEYKPGDKVNVKILNYDEKKDKLLLSIKQAQPDPWTVFKSKYSEGDTVLGEVVLLKDFGAFVEIIPGVDGLIHISDMSWTEKISHPSKMVNVGEKVKVKIINIDDKNKKVSLSLKHIAPNPWVEFKSNYPKGSKVRGLVKTFFDNGAEIALENNLTGVIFTRDISWDVDLKPVTEYLEEGKEYEFMVLDVNPDKKKIVLGKKQLVEDPIRAFMKTHKINDIVNGEIVDSNPFGYKVRLEEGVIAILPKREVSHYTYEGQKLPELGDKIAAKIKKYDKRDRRIVISIKDYEKELERKEISKYIDNGKDGVKLGELLKEKLGLINKNKEE